jgi:hypothetical protein
MKKSIFITLLLIFTFIANSKAQKCLNDSLGRIYFDPDSCVINSVLSNDKNAGLAVLRKQIQFNVIPGELKYPDHNRFEGDTVFLKLELAPNKTGYIAFQNKATPLGLQGYLHDNYLGFTYPVNLRDEYFEFQTNEEPFSYKPDRFYLVIKKCF